MVSRYKKTVKRPHGCKADDALTVPVDSDHNPAGVESAFAQRRAVGDVRE